MYGSSIVQIYPDTAREGYVIIKLAYEVRPRKDHRGVDLIRRCARLPAARFSSGSLGECCPAIYCLSNAQSANSTVWPIPMIPSSKLGPSSAIQSPLRIDNAGRSVADGLPGCAAQYDFISSNAIRAGSA